MGAGHSHPSAVETDPTIQSPKGHEMNKIKNKIRSNAMISPKTYDKLCIWSGPIAFLFFFIIFLTSDFLPPIPPRATGEEITSHFRKHQTGIKAGAALMQFAGAFYSMFIAGISGQMSRIPGCSHAMTATQSISGGISTYTITLPSLFFCIAIYRLDRPPELMLLLSDMCWMILIIPFVTFLTSNFALSYAILGDKRPKPLFPHWFAWVSSVWPWGFVGGMALHVVKSGAFAWNGGFTFWVGAASIGVGTVLNVYFMLRAIDTTDEECEGIASLPADNAQTKQQKAEDSQDEMTVSCIERTVATGTN